MRFKSAALAEIAAGIADDFRTPQRDGFDDLIASAGEVSRGRNRLARTSPGAKGDAAKAMIERSRQPAKAARKSLGELLDDKTTEQLARLRDDLEAAEFAREVGDTSGLSKRARKLAGMRDEKLAELRRELDTAEQINSEVEAEWTTTRQELEAFDRADPDAVWEEGYEHGRRRAAQELESEGSDEDALEQARQEGLEAGRRESFESQFAFVDEYGEGAGNGDDG